ncbi:hypothetical protein ACFQX4_26475 [Roseomonas sp. GCM10028921]
MQRFPQRTSGFFLLTSLLLLPLQSQAEGEGRQAAPKVEVTGTDLRIVLVNGRAITGVGLVGTVLALRDPSNHRIEVRIDGVQPDPMDHKGETTL